MLGAIIFYLIYYKIITQIKTIFKDLKQICWLALLIAPKLNNAYEVQIVFKVKSVLVLDKIEIDINVYK